MKIFLQLLIVLLIAGCNGSSNKSTTDVKSTEISGADLKRDLKYEDSSLNGDSLAAAKGSMEVLTGNVSADTVVSFAEKFAYMPNKPKSTSAKASFDGAGFITYVFTRFGINVPRTAKEFEYVGEGVLLFGAKRGDLIMFAGDDTTDKTIVHIGIITDNTHGRISFVHADGKPGNGVSITQMNKEYNARYRKTVRVFNL